MIKVIAEIGWNHCGDIDLAKNFIISAKENGANYAKFQTWSTSRLKNGSWDNDGRREIYEKAELSREDHIELIKCCNENNISFMSSVFSIPDAQLLKDLDCNIVKIPSFESRNKQLISFCDSNFNEVVMSCGTSTYEEIRESVSLIKNADLYLMHCVSVYPGEYFEANIPKMIKLKSLCDKVGLSDHIEGVESSKVAIGEGAVIIEKHFTIDKNLPGRDNKFAILPNQLKDLTDFIKNRDMMLVDLGSGFNKKEEDSRINYTGRFNG
jgi:N,N'-diacetyllegionaminate synthase|tara:strand:- start:2350 stop:3150 length:801 start_codon:yes stop_codon:yes gene_type:complete